MSGHHEFETRVCVCDHDTPTKIRDLFCGECLERLCPTCGRCLIHAAPRCPCVGDGSLPERYHEKPTTGTIKRMRNKWGY